MKGKDEIKELFQKELGNYQAKVDTSLWNGIQAGLGSTAPATGVVSSLGLTGKIIIGVSVAAAVTVGTIFIVNNNTDRKENKKTITEHTISDLVNEKSSNESDLIEGNSIEIPTIEKESTEVDKEIENIKSKAEYSKQENVEYTTVEYFDNTAIISEKNNISKEDKNEKFSSEKVNIVQSKPSDASVIEILNDQKQSKVDLSKVNIEIVMQNNQYVNFSAVEVPTSAQITWDLGDGNYERSLNPEHFYAEAGIYNVVLKVQSGTEEITKNIKVEIQLKGKIGDLPNVFTPNGDGRNDIFFIECKHLKTFQLTIMDNNQNVVFSTNDSNFRWNGFDKNGTPVKEGNYVYMIVAEDDAGNVINKYQRLNIQR